MKIGMIGLGKMGSNMARRLLDGGHVCVVFDLDCKKVARLEQAGAMGVDSLDEFVCRLPQPAVVWIMLPAGEITEQTIAALSHKLQAGDIVIDGGNSHYKDAVRRADELKEKGIHYVDVGTSGGVWGLGRGYCLMIGGEEEVVRMLDPIFRALAPGAEKGPSAQTVHLGYLHCGPAGAGHFVKMVHNGIEYGLMQAYAEGFDILRQAGSEGLPKDYRYAFDLPAIAEVWRHGSVIGSWLLDLTAAALAEDPALSNYTGYVHDSGEGRWTIQAAIEAGVPADVLAAALFARFHSRQAHTFAEKVLSAMRHQFGGHVETAGN